MSEVHVYAIVSASGEELSVTVGDVTYVADYGFKTLREAVESSSTAQNIVMDGVVNTDSRIDLRGGTLIGVNQARIADGVDTTGYGVLPFSSNTSVLGMTFSGNTANPAVTRIAGSANITVANCLYDDNYSANSAGVIRSYGKTVQITGTTFSGNSTCAILCSQNGGTVSIRDSAFLDNITHAGYGAIFNDTTTGVLIVEDTFFSGNSTNNAGGAIRNSATLVIGGATFLNNTGSQGAAIYNEGSMTIDGMLTLGASQTIRSVSGKTIYVKSDSFLDLSKPVAQVAKVVDGVGTWNENSGTWSTDEGCTLITGLSKDLYVTNAASEEIVTGVAMISADKSVDCVVAGGTVYVADLLLNTIDLSYNWTTFIISDLWGENRRQINYAIDKTIIGVGDSGFRNGYHSSDGGALYFGDAVGHNYKIQGLTFTGNTTGSRGGAVYFYNCNAEVADCVFSGNTSPSGAAVYRHTGTGDMVISGSTFLENRGSSGTVHFNRGSAAVNRISDSLFYGNTMSSGGGGVYVYGDSSIDTTGVTISGSTFSKNVGDNGGVISARSNAVINIDNCLFDGNTATGAGAVFHNGDVGVVFNISNTTFRNNRAGTQGGVVRLNAGGTINLSNVVVENNSAGSNTFYIYGASGKKAYVYVSGLVTMGAGQSFRYDGNYNEFRVLGSSFFSGYGVAKAVDANASFNSWFVSNTNGTIGAETGYSIFVVADSNNNDMYVTNADAMVTTAHSLVSVKGNTFNAYSTLSDAQAAGVDEILLFDFAQSGSVSVSTDTVLIGGGTSAIGGSITVTNDAALTLAGDFTLASALTVDGGAATLQDLTLAIDSGLISGDFYTMISSVSIAGADDLTIVLDGEVQTMDQWFELGDTEYRFTVKDGALGAERHGPYDVVYAVLNGATSTIIGGTVVDLTGGNAFTSIADATEYLAAGGLLTVVGATTAANVKSTRTLFVDSTFTANTWFNENTFTGGMDVAVERLTMPTAGANLYVLGHWSPTDGDVNFTATASEFQGDISLFASGETVTICHDVTYTITDTFVAGGVYGGGSSNVPTIGGDINIALSGSTVLGTVIGDRANRISAEQSIAVTLAGSTVGGVAKFDYNKTYEYVLAPLTLTVTGATNSVIGTLSDADKLVINAGARADFTLAQDLTSVDLTVDGSQYAGTPITVATGVVGIGDYTISGSASSVLAVDGRNLVLTTASDIIDENSYVEGSFSGGTVNVMTGGTITGAFFGKLNPAGGTDIITSISGGTVVNAMIGGAKVTASNTASIGNVTLDISGDVAILGGTANGGMLYTAGYAYGASASAVDANPTLSVTKSTLNLAEGSAPVQNLYAGAHARKGAYTSVGSTEINVAGGTYKRIYGGGWAEKNALSVVGSSTITVSGGSLDFIYAGGGNAAGGETRVTGNVDISVSNDATVNFAFLAGKNQYCTIGGAVTMTVSGAAKSMTRISGHNACGTNGTEGTTTLNVDTDLNLKYLDYVDVVRIAEGKTLNVEVNLSFEANAAAPIDFVLDGDLDKDWDVVAGKAAYECFEQMSEFRINGVECTRDDATGALGTSGYYLLDDETNKKFVFSKNGTLA